MAALAAASGTPAGVTEAAQLHAHALSLGGGLPSQLAAADAALRGSSGGLDGVALAAAAKACEVRMPWLQGSQLYYTPLCRIVM